MPMGRGVLVAVVSNYSEQPGLLVPKEVGAYCRGGYSISAFTSNGMIFTGIGPPQI